jgi:dihydroxyacetone kinase
MLYCINEPTAKLMLEKVGNGMLAAAVSGEVFASPSAKQVMAAIEHSPSDVGIILCITNYTGDNLHFGLAKEKALGMGKKVAILRMTDDVALGRQQTSNLGRRGLAGNLFGESDHARHLRDPN